MDYRLNFRRESAAICWLAGQSRARPVEILGKEMKKLV